jgi:hypothetical protein
MQIDNREGVMTRQEKGKKTGSHNNGGGCFRETRQAGRQRHSGLLSHTRIDNPILSDRTQAR